MRFGVCHFRPQPSFLFAAQNLRITVAQPYSHCPTLTPTQTQTKMGSKVINNSLCLYRCLCSMDTSTQLYTTHFLSVSVSGSVNTPYKSPCSWKSMINWPDHHCWSVVLVSVPEVCRSFLWRPSALSTFCRFSLQLPPTCFWPRHTQFATSQI